MNTTSQSTEHIRKHRTGKRPHRRPSARHMDRLSRKVKGKLNLTADQERDFDALVKSFNELRNAHTDEWLKVEAASPYEAMESAMSKSLEKISEIHQQAEVFRWTLSEEQQAIFDKLMKRRGHRDGRRHRIKNRVS
jgi:hypothetical protein